MIDLGLLRLLRGDGELGSVGVGGSGGRGGYLPVMMITGDEVGLGMVVGEE